MNIEDFVGKTIKEIRRDYTLEITFTDKTKLQISSRFEGGIDVYVINVNLEIILK